MKIGASSTTGWRATISVAMSNYIEDGSIIAIATSLGFWQAQFGISNFAVGLLAALSANAFGAAIGAILGGPLCDRFGRKAIYTYDLLVYMAKQQASDLHLKPMRPPLLRIRGKLVPIKSDPLKPADLEKMLLPLLNRAQKEKFENLQSVDFGYGVAGVARFRAYASHAESFADYARLMSTSPRYQAARAQGQDASAFAAGLQRAGYATDPAYAEKLTRVINTALRLQRVA